MAAIKKYNGSTWETTTARKYETATETIQSGDTIYADGTAATLSIEGNTVQNGTPSPSSPVDVVGVGERTENLAPEIRSANGWVVGYLNGNDGSYNPNNYNGEWLSPNIPISSGETITISAMSISNPSMSVYYWNGSTFMYGESANNYSGSSFTTPLNTTHIRIALRAGSDNKTEEAVISSGFWLMLNTGSTAKPFEPYGYKLDISNGGKNLFDGAVRNAIINDSTGEEQSNANWRCSNFIEVSAEKVTLSWTSNSQFYQAKLGYYGADETFISTETVQGYFYSGTFTIPNNCKYIKISYSTAVSGNPASRENIMLNTGSSALPYEPYNRTTTPVYLGEAQTIRQIGKYIFDGSNIFTTQQTGYRNNTALFATTVMTGTDITNRPSMNNYFVVPSSGINPQSLDYACSGFNPYYQFSGYYYLRVPYDVIGMTDSNTDNEFITALNTWLSSLYNSGNPMIAYYALATPETAVVNEPLMKIGDYADTLSNATAIPTTEGANTISVDTTVQPSEFTATWTGWHDAEVKEWDGSQWQ